ncbi:hypothetical protein HGRIS_012072 [Hohenbuehelia grisea]|uniref:Uncharacterized protein n=1 Tax=Hohenbuehelia grisea TaxID=104357 RepID=A0ABR3IR59_9AGAR
MRVWWTNKNPRLITKYFLDAVRELGGALLAYCTCHYFTLILLLAIPVTTQSDPGTENYGVANVQTLARHELDPTLADTLQHRWMSKAKNVKSEANWSVLRRDFTIGFELLFEEGVQKGWYDVDVPLENLIFRWLAVPWMQKELDEWVIMRNNSLPRANKHKVLPHGIPAMIRLHPELYGTTDFKIPIPMDVVDRLEGEYAPNDHPVFELTPPEFDRSAEAHYTAIGSPQLDRDTFWLIYCELKARFLTGGLAEPVQEVIAAHVETMRRVNEDDAVVLLPNLHNLRQGDNVIGDLAAAEAKLSGWDVQGGGSNEAYITSSDEESSDSDVDDENIL